MAHQRSSRFYVEIFGNPAASNRIKTLATDPDDSVPAGYEDDEDGVKDGVLADDSASVAAGGLSRAARRGVNVPKTAFKLWRLSVDGAERFEKLPWQKLQQALDDEWAAMSLADKAPFVAQVAESVDESRSHARKVTRRRRCLADRESRPCKGLESLWRAKAARAPVLACYYATKRPLNFGLPVHQIPESPQHAPGGAPLSPFSPICMHELHTHNATQKGRKKGAGLVMETPGPDPESILVPPEPSSK